MKTMLPLARDQRGFSLAELLIVIAILGLMLTGLLAVQMQGQKAYLIGSHRVEVQQNGRVALELMIRQLRSATSVTAIPSATDMTFQYEDVGVPGTFHTVRYQLTGAVLNQTLDGVTTPLIGGVVTFNLTYFSDYDGSTNTGTTTAVAGSVSSIRVQLVTGTEESVASYSDANQRATMEMLVRLRNHL
jgi:prepilin-type N-terminal cleavage/methylation domain-containing protein